MSAASRAEATGAPVRLQAVGHPPAQTHTRPARRPLARRTEESIREFGRRAIATAVLQSAGALDVTWPAPDSEASAWLRRHVLELTWFVEALPTRTYCGCPTYDGEVVTALLHTWLSPEHLCDTDCDWSATSSWLCRGQAWVDCQRCARTDIGPVMGIGSTCDRCGCHLEWRDAAFLSATAGDVVVLARLCHACERREGLSDVVRQPC